MSTRGPHRRVPRFGAVVPAALALLLALTVACTADDAQQGGGDDDPEDAMDLAAAPSPNAVLPEDRGEPPTSLQVVDLVEGSGEVAEPGDEVTVEYLGWRWSDAGEFASSWGAGEPWRFELGSGSVIPGWDQGILGERQQPGPLRVGGRRVLTIPPQLAYGERGSGSAIGPGETLVFVIDLVAVHEDPTGDGGPESERPDG